MKELLLVVLILLGVVLALFFVDTTPRVPLAVSIAGTTNVAGGGVDIYFTVSNKTAQVCIFWTYPQALSDAVWFTSVEDRAAFGGTKGLVAHANSEQIIYTCRNATVTRLQIRYQLVETPRQKMINDFFEKFHFGRFYDHRPVYELTTPPFDLPPR